VGRGDGEREGVAELPRLFFRPLSLLAGSGDAAGAFFLRSSSPHRAINTGSRGLSSLST
jgi:hypothetical protein